MGGKKNNGTEYIGMAVLSQDRKKWIEIELELPDEASGSGAIYLNGEIYLFGGVNNLKALYKLDKNLKWIRLADMIVGRRRISNSCLEGNGNIWVFGGQDENYKPLKSVERYDPKENKWTLMADMTIARSNAAATLWNNKIIICGGWNADYTLTKTAGETTARLFYFLFFYFLSRPSRPIVAFSSPGCLTGASQMIKIRKAQVSRAISQK